MYRKRWISAWLLLLISALACGLPLRAPSGQGNGSASTVEAAAAQTIAAQQLEATGTAAGLGLDVTATASAAAYNATQTEISSQATLSAGAFMATGTALSLASTSAAQIAQATAIAAAQTSTAQAYNPPPPPPPPSQPPPPAAQGNATRIRFASGATSATVEGQIQPNQRLDYVLRALQGQTMLVNVYTPNNDVFLGVTGLSDGVQLLRPSAGSATFSGVLPGTQDYRISLVSSAQASNYTLQVIVPARIQFAKGAISAQVNGFLQGREVNFYLLRALAGQTMTVNILSPANDIFLTIYGMQDGSPLVRSVMGQTSWTGVLPATQDYMIEAVSTGASANYTLQTIVQ